MDQNAEISPEFLSRLSDINLLQYAVQNSRHETRLAHFLASFSHMRLPNGVLQQN
jgi:hypothetical protein